MRHDWLCPDRVASVPAAWSRSQERPQRLTSSGRGMTWALTSSPTLPAASAPASTAARTLPTSPLTSVVTYAAADLDPAGQM